MTSRTGNNQSALRPSRSSSPTPMISPAVAILLAIAPASTDHPINPTGFNNAKISDHFAIIPTGALPKSLSEPEQKLFDMVTKRFLAVFYPAAEFLETVRITRVESEPFKSTGKVMVKAGWLEVYGK